LRRSFLQWKIPLKTKTENPKPKVGAPPPWFGWLSPTTGLAALIVSLVSAFISLQAFRVNQANRQDLITPKLSVTEVALTHPAGKMSDLPVVTYEIKNFGALTAKDIHSQLRYQYVEAPVDLREEIPKTSVNSEGVELGAKLVPTDHLDRTYALFQFVIRTGSNPDTFAPAKTPPSYRKLRGGLAMLLVEVSKQASDSVGYRIVTCDSFNYQWLTDKFERRGACLAYDITDSFRNPRPTTNMRIDPSTNTLIPDK